MKITNRRRFLQIIAATTGLTLTSHLYGCSEQNNSVSTGSNQAALNRISIGGSPIVITILMAYLAKQSQLQEAVKEIDFRIWKTHDQLRADAVSGTLQVSETKT